MVALESINTINNTAPVYITTKLIQSSCAKHYNTIVPRDTIKKDTRFISAIRISRFLTINKVRAISNIRSNSSFFAG